MPRRGGILGTSNGEETPGARSELLQVLYISSAPGTFPDSPGGASGSWLNWQNTCTYSLYVGAMVTKPRVECGARRERCNGGQWNRQPSTDKWKGGRKKCEESPESERIVLKEAYLIVLINFLSASPV